jgi:ATP-binding cassette subfamily C protein CydC
MSDLWRLLKLFRPYAGWLALGILASLATLLANVTLMAVSGWFIASMALAGVAQVSMNYFTPAALIRASAIIRTGGRYAERLITHEATLRLLSALRVWFYQHLEPLAPARLQHYRGGDLLSRIRADIDTLDNFYLRILAPSVSAVLGGLLLVLFLRYYDTRLALILAFFLLLAGVLTPWIVQRFGDAPGRRKLALQTELRMAAVDGIQGMAELQLYGGASAQADKLSALSQQLAEQQQRLSGLNGLSQGALMLAANLAMWAVLWTAIPLVRDGVLAPPELAMLALFTLAAFEAVLPLPNAFQALGETRAAARRIFEIIDAEPEVAEPQQPSPTPTHFGLRFDGVSFTYPDAEHAALEDVSFELAQGQRLALIGASGAGKSTLAQLLLRFRAPDQGRILLGDQDLGDFHGEDLRQHIAVVSQHTHLFNGTLNDNLRLANPAAEQAAIEQACRSAQIDDFIRQQPDGYDTWIGEAGLTLSGGQARRIAIARALLKDAPILILDEPSEGLDNPTAKALLQAVDELMQQRTVLLITHRRDGLHAMDQVLQLDEGRLIDSAQ